MKRFSCIFLFLIFIMPWGFSEINLFSLPNLDTYINIEKMVDMKFSWEYDYLEKDSKQNVIKVIEKKRYPHMETEQTIFYNSQGLPEKNEGYYHDYFDDIYKYDEKGRLLSYTEVFQYKYIDDFQREEYCRGKLKSTEILDFQKDKIIITIKSHWTNREGIAEERITRIYEYNFENGCLTDVCSTSFKPNGTEDKGYLKLFYDEEKIIKIQEYYGDGGIRLNEYLLEYQNGKLVKCFFNDHLGPITIYEYSNFDKYGNFQNRVSIHTATGEENYSCSRIIEYK